VTTVFERVAVPRGERLLDTAAQQEHSHDERMSWLTCMLFIAVKMVVRGKESPFLDFLEHAYREVRDAYRLDGLLVTDPASLAGVDAMLGQLVPHAQDRQRRAIDAIRAFVLEVAHDRLSV
jgi:hypothetical protein